MASYKSPEPLFNQGLNESDIGLHFHPNGTPAFIDLRYPVNTWCNASIQANADIAGPGIQFSFIVPAVLTILIAAVRAVGFVVVDYSEWSSPASQHSTVSHYQRQAHKLSIKVIDNCDTIIISLCDLQSFSGMAIIVAGLLQGSQLSFYHEEIIVIYWYLIMNSFWATQRRAADDDEDLTVTNIRKLLVISAVGPAIVFEIRELVRQPRDWDFLDGTKCYITWSAVQYYVHGVRESEQKWRPFGIHHIEVWFTLVGMTIYVLTLSATLFEKPRDWIEEKEQSVYRRLKTWWTRCVEEKYKLEQLFRKAPNYPTPSRQKTSAIEVARICIYATCYFLAAAGGYCFAQWISFWSYLEGSEPVQVCWYLRTVILDLAHLFHHIDWSRDLISGNEHSWGFGQCLPMVMLGAMLFTLYMSFHEKHIKNKTD